MKKINKIKDTINYLFRILKPIKYKFFDWYSFNKSKGQDISDFETICLILGPYRNLTTLFSSILFLHPDCQVLNHAGSRIHGNKKIDFLSNYNNDVVENFIRFSIEISSKGEAGSYGGSITLSHAFKSNSKINFFANQKYNTNKDNSIKSLVWKESLINTNVLRSDGFNLNDLIKKEKRLRFMLPIRNPLDCAVSNIRTGHAKIFKGTNAQTTSYDVLEKVIDQIYWFILKKEKFPDRFFYFFENDISENLFSDIQTFLKLNPDKNWIANAKLGFVVKSDYKHDNHFVNFYRELINNKFNQFPLLLQKFQSFS